MTRTSQPVQQNNVGSVMRSLARAVGTALVQWSDDIGIAVLSVPTTQATPPPAKPKDREWVEQLLASSGTTALDLQGADLSRADLSNLDLSGTSFQNANLSKARLQGTGLVGADLRDADCENCSFLDADLREALFFGANLREAQITAYSFRINPMRFRPDWRIGDHLLAISTGEIADFHRARQAVLMIARALQDQGHFDEAATFRVLAMRIDRGTSNPLRRARWYQRGGRLRIMWPSVFRRALRWIGSISVDLLCVYGESVWRVLFWMTTILLFFGPLAVLVAGGLYWPPEAARIYLRLPQTWQQTLYAYSQYILYMFDTFTTADFSLMEPRNDAVRLVSGMLAMTGIFLAGLLGFVSGNRIRRD